MDPGILTNNWGRDWAWGLPLIVLTVLIHAYALGRINEEGALTLGGAGRIRNFSTASILVMGGSALAASILHGFEGMIWAVAYRFLGALQDNKSAMLYSLNAMTSYGHASLVLAPRWELMGALEALNGWILFGLTTAFLFTVMQKAWWVPGIDRAGSREIEIHDSSPHWNCSVSHSIDFST
jgi:hypothetical protein